MPELHLPSWLGFRGASEFEEVIVQINAAVLAAREVLYRSPNPRRYGSDVLVGGLSLLLVRTLPIYRIKPHLDGSGNRQGANKSERKRAASAAARKRR